MEYAVDFILVYRLAYNGDVARRSPGQLAVFQGGPSRTGGKAPISGFIRVESGSRRTEKQPTGRGPEGCVENGPVAAELSGYAGNSAAFLGRKFRTFLFQFIHSKWALKSDA